MNNLIIKPVGQIQEKILEDLSEKIEEVQALPINKIKNKRKIEIPEKAHNSERNQYRASDILKQVLSEVKISEKEKLLAITQVDLYSKNLNFVFGQARCPGKACIISLHRLRPEFYEKKENNELFITRAAKEAVHELGHAFGLGHCKNSECVMSFSNSVVDVDKKKLEFCENCRKRLSA